ncbi:hypothetical protein HU200_004439 [Digitaria exilis]|uniref:SMP domain-containing protein n=1 Tax=Digitaria exilis TaxID=1010633 RepID=A0A835FW00_9POAL|nr:hypothetical protein HU200_004439 [Digitaria exilis]CAB3493249.1 unnamed protein product [Digitaria exilis]
MEARPDRIECPEPPEQPEPTNPGRVFDTERVATPRDATESVTEQLAHGGSHGAVDETYDTRFKIAEALEGSARAIGDKPVEPSDAAAIRAAEASAIGRGGAGMIPEGVAEGARAAAASNASAVRGENMVTMADVLTWEATMKLPTGKAEDERGCGGSGGGGGGERASREDEPAWGERGARHGGEAQF